MLEKETRIQHQVASEPRLPRGDYVSDGLAVVVLDGLFPHMVVGDKAAHPWPFLRREVPHNWYCDSRYPEVGFLDRDEVLLLYNLALQFRGKPGLEIGCWMGWSTCHLALAGLELDVIDPVLANRDHESSVRHALEHAGAADRVRLYRTPSPEAVDRLAQARGAKWNFFFIDGDHEASAPEADARVCLQYAAEDALFVFHDLVSPDVEKGLAVLRDAGLRTMIYETMQIVGIAWRGKAAPVKHVPDPACDWSLPRHLLKYTIAGENPAIRSERMSGLLQEAEERAARGEARLAEAASAARLTEERLAANEAALAGLAGNVDALEAAARARETEIARLNVELERREQSARLLEGAVASADAALSETRKSLRASEERFDSLLRRVNQLNAEQDSLRSALGEAQSTAEALHRRIRRQRESFSWTLTSPLREIRRVLRKVARCCSGAQGTRAHANPLAAGRGNPLDVVRRYALLHRSPLMNRSYYRRTYPDSAKSRLGRFWHYATVGAPQLRQPCAIFDPKWYLERNPDVAAARADPLIHYLRTGWKEGRNPHPLFDVAYYLRSNPDVARAGVEPLSHFIARGGREGRNPNAMFDSAWYLARHAEVADSTANPLEHYVTAGARQGYEPHPLFDSVFYLQRKPELALADANPLADYLAHGPDDYYNPEPSPDPVCDRGICFVTPDFVGPISNGGIGTACYHYALALARSGHKVTVLFSEEISRGQTNHWRRHYAKLGINFLSMADLPPQAHFTYGDTWFLARSHRILDFLADKAFDFVHFQDWKANGFWPIRAKRLGYALQNSVLTVMMHSSSLWIAQGMEEFPKDAATQAGLLYCEAYCMRQCDLVLSPSQHMLDWAAENSIRLAENRRIVRYVDEDYAVADGPDRAPDLDHLIFFGRLETRKGLHVFADALRLLKQRRPERLPRRVSLLGKHATVGGVGSESFLESLATELPEIEFAAFTTFDRFRAIDYIKSAGGLVVMPSRLDNCPLSVIECIEHRIPFLAAATGGIPEIVDERALFVPNPAELAKRLAARDEFDFRSLAHKYAAEAARKTWLDLHQSFRPARNRSREGEDFRIGVCIPFYNHGQYLARLIEAFRNQTYPSFEVVVVNDGSTGDSAVEFERVARACGDPRFRFLSTANQGPGAARNRAASMIAAEYLMFFDADNLPKDAAFIARLAAAIKTAGVDCVTVPYDLVDRGCLEPSESDVMCAYRPMGGCIEAGFFENVFGDTTMIVRRAVFDTLGGFSAQRDSWEDHEFLLKLCLKGFNLEVYPQSLLYYRTSSNGRYRSSNHYRNFKNLMMQLAEAPPRVLMNIVRDVALPAVLESRY